ncbi:repressor LexA [Breznakia sp. PF5-3]|uniref:LexA family protein n=1 Tax=unclassified Breznakia TaxID=2623764 RepID=UPI0024066E59|nr:MULTISPECIES: S24 family peptidase [unclassified Breznakia]MDF9825631.1 repressor LexA [Breznakia sp. PM6-1]MDF9836455.1 repressor LexA [Breznakia sp. PF5-3]MDF9838632.1 repressor LexA [Breznakia sp. PFB2-8]MDF9860663.1 repressor LexA [Breznakia sp. PH5-24]
MQMNEYIRRKRKSLKLTTEQVAKYVGVSMPTVTRWETGEIKNIKNDKILKLATILEIDPMTLISWDNQDSKEHSKKMKPVLGFVKAGYDLIANEQLLGYEEVSDSDVNKGDYFLQVKGDSMIGSHIFDGSKVYVKAQSDVNSGDIAVVVINGDEATIKKVIKEKNLLILEATNPDYENRYFTAQEVNELPVSIIGRVVSCKIEF